MRDFKAMDAARVRAGLKPLAQAWAEERAKVPPRNRSRARLRDKQRAAAALFRHQIGQVPDHENPLDVTGWVYFAGAYDREKLVYIKIGYTAAKNPNTRVSSIRQGTAHTVKLLAATPGCRALEVMYLVEFRRTHVKGEWFEPSPDLQVRIDTINARRDSWKPWYGRKKQKTR